MSLGDNSGVPKHASWLLQHVTACETSDALQEIHDQEIKGDSSAILSNRRNAAQIPTRREREKTILGKRNSRGPGAARRLQLCGIASAEHPPVCTSRRENASTARGCFNIYSAASDWCAAESSQMLVSLSRRFFLFLFFFFTGDAGLSAT